MHRFYVPPEDWRSGNLSLREAESHHACNVLRLKESDKIVAFDGQGREATASIELGSSKREVRVHILQTSNSPPLSCRITLAQAIPKGKNMDLIVQKATELGAAEIAPLISERTVARIDDNDEAAAKRAKWQAVVIEAAKQCGQNWLPNVAPAEMPKEFFSKRYGAFDLMLIASLQSDSRHLRGWLDEHLATHQKAPENVLILVGPEGDFTPAEINLARSAGCRPVSLGPIVLRTETAAIYCLSILSYELLTRG